VLLMLNELKDEGLPDMGKYRAEGFARGPVAQYCPMAGTVDDQ
jgi:hypothetical protein